MKTKTGAISRLFGLIWRGGRRSGGRRGCRCGLGRCGLFRLLRRRLLLFDGGFGRASHDGFILVQRRIGKRQGCQHKENGDDRCHPSEETGRTAAAEDGLARAAECRSHAGAFSGLKQDDEDQNNTNDNM